MATSAEQVALDQRAANLRAAEAGRPLPFPNVWDALDATKAARDASPAEILASHEEFRRRCRPRPRKRHAL